MLSSSVRGEMRVQWVPHGPPGLLPTVRLPARLVRALAVLEGGAGGVACTDTGTNKSSLVLLDIGPAGAQVKNMMVSPV